VKSQTEYSLDSQFVKRLDNEIIGFIRQGIESHDEERFNDLAKREFELQYHTVEPYRKYCLQKNATPENITDWRKIPAVPSLAFKKFILTTFPVEKAEHAYFTSGTTNPSRKGSIYRDKGAVDLINTANGLLTREYVFPDVDRMKILLMTPSPNMAPGIGMAIGLERVRTEFGTPESAYLISRFGLNVELLLKSLMESEKSGEPLALIGSTTGFIYFLKACEKEGIRFKLPHRSRICDGGGYTGQFGECSKEEYFEKCNQVLGVEDHYCINVLGMGEISTNFFDNVLRDYLNGKVGKRYKIIPPWTRTEVVDINTFKRLPDGETGLLKHYDLVNRAMVMAVQTDNLGFMTEDGFEIVGRWKKRAGKLDAEGIKAAHGGKVMTQMVNFLLKRNLKKVKDVYKKLSKNP
jgi:hypothetical protein